MSERPFVAVSGLPGSGKSTLGVELAEWLGLPLFDKDDILESLFDNAGVVDIEARQRLSRASDTILAQSVGASHGAVVVSFWRHDSASTDSGTPTSWLRSLSGALVEVHCVCSPHEARRRFKSRKRHPGHNDDTRAVYDFEGLARQGPLDLGSLVTVRTDEPVDMAALVREVRGLLP